MPKRVAITQMHPDPAGGHLCHALTDACAEGAAACGHEVVRIEGARIEFSWLRTMRGYGRSAV